MKPKQYRAAMMRPLDITSALQVMAEKLRTWNVVGYDEPAGIVPVAIVIPSIEELGPAAYNARARELAAARELYDAARFARQALVSNGRPGPCVDLAIRRLNDALAAADGEPDDARR